MATASLLSDLSEYMITSTLYDTYNTIEVVNPKPKDTTKTQVTNPSRIYLKDTDKLFWYFFIMKYGYMEYTLIGNHKFQREKSLKIENVEMAKHNNSVLKAHKISVTDYEHELVCSPKISVNTFKGLCAYNHVNVLYVKNNKLYYEFKFDEESDACSIVYLMDNGYSCELQPSRDTITSIKETCYFVENINKPIKGVSSYKLNELKEIATKLGCYIQTGNKAKTKSQLYADILTQI